MPRLLKWSHIFYWREISLRPTFVLGWSIFRGIFPNKSTLSSFRAVILLWIWNFLFLTVFSFTLIIIVGWSISCHIRDISIRLRKSSLRFFFEVKLFTLINIWLECRTFSISNIITNRPTHESTNECRIIIIMHILIIWRVSHFKVTLHLIVRIKQKWHMNICSYDFSSIDTLFAPHELEDSFYSLIL